MRFQKFASGRAKEDQGTKLRACLKTARDPVFRGKRCMARRATGASPKRAVTEEQRSQTAFCAKTPRAAVLLAAACVGSVVTARCGDAPASPPWPQPKSLAAGPLGVFKQALCSPPSTPGLHHSVTPIPCFHAFSTTTSSCPPISFKRTATLSVRAVGTFFPTKSALIGSSRWPRSISTAS
jgi:hypothetical protein